MRNVPLSKYEIICIECFIFLTLAYIPGGPKKTEPELFALDPLKTVENQ